jgi:hypothetical protein
VRPAFFVPNPHVRMDRPQGTPYVPIESLSLMAVAEQAGLETRLFDLNRLIAEGSLRVEPDMWARAAAELGDLDPSLLVMETWADTFHHTVLLLRSLRPALPHLPVIFVGAGTSALAEQALAAIPEADGVIRGEGEPAMAVLARTAPSRLLPKAPGLVRRTALGVESAELAFVDDLDALPRPAFHRACLRPGDSIPVEAGRGCDVGCSFCALAGQWSRRYRPRRPDSLAQEMVELARRFPGSVIDLCQDPRFFVDPTRVRELCRCLSAYANRPRFTCHSRVDALDGPMLTALAQAGCCGILFGVESGCPEMQARIGKRLDLSRMAPTLGAASRLRVATRATFIVGFPGETDASLARTAKALVDTRQAGAQTAVQIFRAQPGTPGFEEDCSRLVPEPLLSVVSPDDREAQALVTQLPQFHTASFRVQDALPRGRIVGSWHALTVFAEPFAALVRHGAEPGDLLAAIFVGDEAVDLDRSASIVAEQIMDYARRACLVDHVALEDALAYRMALGRVGRMVEGSSSPFNPAQWDRLAPDAVHPLAVAPFEHLSVWTPLARLLAGDLTPGHHATPVHLVVAKVVARSGPTYFTRQSAVVETYTVGRLAPLLLPLCDGHRSLQGIAETVAAQTGKSVNAALRACRAVVAAFAKAGVLESRSAPAP